MTDEISPKISEPVSPSEGLQWHIPNEVLAEMSDIERAIYLNEKITRVYDALDALRAGNGKINFKELDKILNPEKYPYLEDRSDI